ncbi:MAG TPA: ABC transporter ATP-binding protein [Candidatus Sumerlaeota bacterium]|nr:ABC transporter ATP-binding protein [Candidatus Sumerlaeota bacterium]HOR27873.1 ABC transporter ATP-binding protein [Candidatus Sumerlaeota bacterium]HPK00924.1 ABC transporter ATP-binding protein [Candidatus Sumerlaeota bacterium]
MPDNAEAPAIVRRAETTPGAEAATPWAVRMRDIGKAYRLGETRALKDNFREELTSLLRRGFGLARRGRGDKGTFWALRDINLEIARGETVGIIGRNGAGKSTLLKILSRITAPTTGEMRYRGRLASLLEVGTGFHRELTGRENIYLNGAILGMRRAEIAQQFDAIVEFAGIEQFLDTPVKFYSSGMYVRLAFSVAAHLRTDIMVVDEVLAVGDAQFQKKCLGKMENAAHDGRTILFVSHNMGAIQNLCRTSIYLDAGAVRAWGRTSEVFDQYIRDTLGGAENGGRVDLTIRNPPTQGPARLLYCELRNRDNELTSVFRYREPLRVTFGLEVLEPLPSLSFHLGVDRLDGTRVYTSDSEENDLHPGTMLPGTYIISFQPRGMHLMPGDYKVSKLMARQGRQSLDLVMDVTRFHVTNVPLEGPPPAVGTGIICGSAHWEVAPTQCPAEKST